MPSSRGWGHHGVFGNICWEHGMNWEKSRALTPLKRGFLQAFFSKDKRFFLTGGSALGLFYLDHRLSYDLDLFTCEMPEWLEVDGLVRWCAREIGATSEILRDSPTFRRYRLHREGASEIIDFVLAIDRQLDEEKAVFDNVRVDTLHEIFVNRAHPCFVDLLLRSVRLCGRYAGESLALMAQA
jgi:hypothetical protein